MRQLTQEQKDRQAEALERRIERSVDHLDARLMKGGMSQHDYDLAMKDLNAWANAQYQRLGR